MHSGREHREFRGSNVSNSQTTPLRKCRRKTEATALPHSPPLSLVSPPGPAGTWYSGWPPAEFPLCSAACQRFRWAGGLGVWRTPDWRTSRADAPSRCASEWRRARTDIRTHPDQRGTAAGTTAVSPRCSTGRRKPPAPYGPGTRTEEESDPADQSEGDGACRSLRNHQGTKCHDVCRSCWDGNERLVHPYRNEISQAKSCRPKARPGKFI